ncbi:hypothetical protein IC757_16065 [Wenzhouxiangella sp. AB-CW3]|uniref:hypothetical protein n=1 Tax=Wenzhouxiangella sp. AB-CW3 TaxID=2771012 RepID=UPI00168AEA93|nr:hypothetical protein [Wenzhouxiangella sp. AB-CW3]QOC22499.1 hypothetical protein IC757_16065 [Wenzhouxiangella sp. AB-CW3]
MRRLARHVGQLAAWTLFLVVIAAFAMGPAFSPVPEGYGELKISMAHLAERVEPCRPLTEEEQTDLPPTRRVTEVCPRGRVPTLVRVRLDGELIIDRRVKAAGWQEDGRAYLLEFEPLPAGHYELELALRDSPREEGYDMQRQFKLALEPGHSALLEIGDGDVALRLPQ